MDEKNIFVFDFTDESIFEDSVRTIQYEILNKKQRKSYEVCDESHDGKIAVEITNIDGEVYKCIYKYMEAEDIYEMIINDESLNLKGIYVNDFDITEIENYEQYLLKDFDANYSFWDGDVSFSRTKFDEGDVKFFGANFGKGNVRFFYANFGKGDVRFEEVNFGGGYVGFVDANFGEGDVIFFGANFGKGDVSFDYANFGEGDVSFDYANFGEGDVSFYDANFGEGEVSFERSNFSRGQVSFAGSNFGKGEVVFETVNLGEHNVSFRSAYVEDIIFIDVIFNNHIDHRFNYVKSLFIQDCIIEKTLKCNGAGYEKLSFLDTVNLGQIYIDWDKNNVKQAIENGKVEYRDYGEIKGRSHTNEEIADQFRMLKENYRNIGYYDEEDKAYYAYMFYKRKVLEETSKNEETGETIKYRTVKRAFYWLFEKIGGYGTKPHTILFWMLGTVLAFGGLQAFFVNSDKGLLMGLLKSMYFSVITFLTIGYGDIHPVGPWSALFAGMEGFLGLFLMSYFTVTIVRKLLR